jgi:hypothetical protein
MEWSEIVQWAKDICSIATCAALLIRPVREWIMGTKEIREGQRCLLRSEIVRIYYRNHDARSLREYEFKNMDQCYDAYKALNGNSFVEKIHDEMKEWDII